MNEELTHAFDRERRKFLLQMGAGLGWVTAAELLGAPVWAQSSAEKAYSRGVLTTAHFTPTAKRVIYLHMLGAVSQADTFDYKPVLEKTHGQELPASVRGNMRLSTMVQGQTSFPVVGPLAKFQPGGQGGAMISDLMPHTRKIADEICIIRTMHTEHVNHDPASKFLHTGFQIAGRPSGGAWVNYALGSNNQDLPTFVVMSSGQAKRCPHRRCRLGTRIPAVSLPGRAVPFRSAARALYQQPDRADLERPARDARCDLRHRKPAAQDVE